MRKLNKPKHGKRFRAVILVKINHITGTAADIERYLKWLNSFKHSV